MGGMADGTETSTKQTQTADHYLMTSTDRWFHRDNAAFLPVDVQ